MAGQNRRRRAVVLGVPAVIVAVLALAALWRLGAPIGSEPGATGTIGLNPDHRAVVHQLEVRQLTSDQTFWAGPLDDDPIFVVSDRPLRIEAGSRVTIEGRLEAAPPSDIARREWRVDDETARAVSARGVYLRASRITSVR